MTSPLRILVVDDDTDAAESLAELFDLEGHVVTIAHSGEEAVAAYRAGQFDIAFMDIMMPGKNGVESFFEIRKLNPQAKVFMMTGYSVEQLIQQAIDNGAMGVLSKPIDADHVLSVLRDVEPAGIALIAEDDETLGETLYGLLVESGKRCKLVTSSDQALELAQNKDIDVIVLDLKLPVIDGVEIYASLKKENLAVPTIIVTGKGEDHPDTLHAIRDLKVTGILNKPFDPAQLLDRLGELAA